MKNEAETARLLLYSEDCTCVFVGNGKKLICRERGISPLLKLYENKKSLSGFFAADKIVGCAAAYLYVLLNPQGIYADVISEPAEKILAEHKIPYSAKTVTPLIINRRGDGPCPMEEAVSNAKNPLDAAKKIKKKFSKMTESQPTL